MEILYIAIAVTALGSIVLSLLARRDQILADQANEVLLQLLQERTAQYIELQQRVRELKCLGPKMEETEGPMLASAPTEAADTAEGGGEDGT